MLLSWNGSLRSPAKVWLFFWCGRQHPWTDTIQQNTSAAVTAQLQKASSAGSSRGLHYRDLHVNVTAGTDRPTFQLHYTNSLNIWEMFTNKEILVTRGYNPPGNCSKRSYLNTIYWVIYPPLLLSTIIPKSTYRLFHSSFTAAFATLSSAVLTAALSAASHTLSPDFVPSAAKALPDT